MRGDPKVYEVLNTLNIPFEYYEHPPVPTVEEASKYWAGIEATHCKNLFFRNHKGNRHYLVILEYTNVLEVKELESLLKQGKLTFASPERMKRFLGLEPGSVSPFGLIHDLQHHVFVFLDENLKRAEKISFHPKLNTASLVISFEHFLKYLSYIKNDFEFVKLYPKKI